MVVIAVLIVLNMRGVRESVEPLIPVFLIFLATHLFVILYAFLTHAGQVPQIIAEVSKETTTATAQIGLWGVLLLVFRSYSLRGGHIHGHRSSQQRTEYPSGAQSPDWQADHAIYGLVIGYYGFRSDGRLSSFQGESSAGLAYMGVDVLEEADKVIADVSQRFPHAVIFGGQLVFPRESLLTRWLHNGTVFSLQRKFYQSGIPFVVLPIRVGR